MERAETSRSRRSIEARLWRSLGEREIECEVCEKRCRISIGRLGACGNYANEGGRLVNVGYGRLSAVESRPIEIKPLFHYWPNSTSTTFSFWGCNFYCPWCQNFHLSFRRPKIDDPLTLPEDLIREAMKSGDEGLCASFNEPIVGLDYLLDLGESAKRRGLYLTLVTNGYFTERALDLLIEAGYDGFSIDIKGCPSMRRSLTTVDHSIVYRNAKRALDSGAHVEMVYLVVTNTNDSEECVEWIIGRHLDLLGPEVPLHVNRYYPAHFWREPPTPLRRLLEISDRARREGIEFVYVGNVGDPELETTRCPRCDKALIARRNYRVTFFGLEEAQGRYRCPRCGRPVPIRGKYVAKRRRVLFL
ncbi:MAG: radical SAM protein [Fervidicoccaceae archaeon]